MVGLMGAFYFSIGVGVIAMRSFEDEVEFVVEHSAKFGVSS